MYADDFIVTGSTKELLEDEIKPQVKAFMQERGLKLSEEKTVISGRSRPRGPFEGLGHTQIESGFDLESVFQIVG